VGYLIALPFEIKPSKLENGRERPVNPADPFPEPRKIQLEFFSLEFHFVPSIPFLLVDSSSSFRFCSLHFDSSLALTSLVPTDPIVVLFLAVQAILVRFLPFFGRAARWLAFHSRAFRLSVLVLELDTFSVA
jgi:hypothetical protein